MQTFTLQFAVSLGAGLGVHRSLDILWRTGSSMDLVAEFLLKSIEGGQRLSQAMLQTTGVFPQGYINLIRTGEESGQLQRVLANLSKDLEKRGALRQRLMAALTYPLMLIAVSGLLVAFLVWFQLPPFLEVFKALKMKLPWPTQLLIWLSNPWVALVGGLVVLRFVVDLWFNWHRPDGRRRILLRAERLPWAGNLLKKMALLGLCRDLALTIENGISLDRSLKLAIEGQTASPTLNQQLELLSGLILRGEPLGSAMSKCRFPGLVVGLLSVAEETGQLSQAFRNASNLLEDETGEALDAVLLMLEPLIMVGLGLTVGMIVLASLLPMYSMLENLGP